MPGVRKNLGRRGEEKIYEEKELLSVNPKFILPFYRTLFAHERGEIEQFDWLATRRSKSNIRNFPCAYTLSRLIFIVRYVSKYF